jgi:hypothetical protein
MLWRVDSRLGVVRITGLDARNPRFRGGSGLGDEREGTVRNEFSCSDHKHLRERVVCNHGDNNNGD